MYWKDEKYVLETSSEILRRAAETLQILEKQKEVFNNMLSRLNTREVANIITTDDVSSVLQRIEIIGRISDTVKRYLVELGKEGNVVSMRLKELTKNLNKEREMILKDYFDSKSSKAKAILNDMNFDFLLETQNISRILFEELHDRPLSPKGIRILSKTSLLEKDIKILLNNFKTLDKIFNADMDSLFRLFKNENMVDSLINDFDAIRKKIIVGEEL